MRGKKLKDCLVGIVFVLIAIRTHVAKVGLQSAEPSRRSRTTHGVVRTFIHTEDEYFPDDYDLPTRSRTRGSLSLPVSDGRHITSSTLENNARTHMRRRSGSTMRKESGEGGEASEVKELESLEGGYRTENLDMKKTMTR